MRGKAAEEKGKRERHRDREKERRERSGVEAAGFLSRHRRSHPTKIDSVSLGSSVQRRATRRTFRPSPRVRSGRERRRVSSVLVVLLLLPFTLISFCLFLSLSRSLFPEESYSTSLMSREKRPKPKARVREIVRVRVAGDEGR